MKTRLFITSAFLLSLLTNIAFADNTTTKSDILTATTDTQIVNELIKKLEEYYVGTDYIKELKSQLTASLPELNKITDKKVLADTLTKKMQAITHDQHLAIQEGENATSSITADDAFLKEQKQQAEEFNSGFIEVKRLKGNIGYVKVIGYAELYTGAGDTIEAVMHFLQYTKALIIDLRGGCNGGSSEAERFFVSYFFKPLASPKELTGIWWRYSPTGRRDSYETITTYDYAPGPHYPGPVYILTDHDVFSACEKTAYDLQSYKRATVVGEVTKGGGNPGTNFPLPANLTVFIPTGKSVNPITHTSWEGTGVQPDVKTTADNAYNTAYQLAIKSEGK